MLGEAAMSEMDADLFCDACSKPVLSPGRFVLRDGQLLHLRCAARTNLLRALKARDVSQNLGERSQALRAQSRRIRAVRSRLPCAACGTSLASADAVIFQGDRLVHARCWSGGDVVTRQCASCGVVLGTYESVAFDGRTAYHVRCWAARRSTTGGSVPEASRLS
jgi:hypothetical protein